MVIIRPRVRIPNQFFPSLTMRNRWFYEMYWDVLAFLMQSDPPIFTTLGEITNADMHNRSTTFWERSGRHSDPNPD